MTESIVVYGVESLSHLKNSKKKIFVIEDDPKVQNVPAGCEFFFLETPLAIVSVLKQIAWKTLFLKTEVFASAQYAKKSLWQKIETMFPDIALGVFLTFSEFSDFGVKLYSNTYKNIKSTNKLWEIESLKNAFSGIPAIIVGAGPSLKKNGHMLKELSSKALIFAGGSALNAMESLQVTPSFAAAIDKEAPFTTFKSQHFFEVPFLYQNRVSSENFSLVHGEKILAGDHEGFPLLTWLNEKLGLKSEVFQAGWNVSTFLIAVAKYFGCGPIILVGMDLAFTENKSYAEGSGLKEKEDGSHLVKVNDMAGNAVLTQKDWLMAAKWIEENHSIINCTEGGLGFGRQMSLQEAKRNLTLSYDLKGLVHQALYQTKSKTLSKSETYFKEIEANLHLFDFMVDEAMVELEKKYEKKPFEEYEDRFRNELVYNTLLQPLWEIFQHILLKDIKQEEIKELNRLLFFKQAIKEHLGAFKC
ncbi:MAG TPA: 6-hydroxymethylpterin diphosphokinase MptE-like protein [Chlamydiales bacterium]|nr:6-hydroxymethylpterin diphosphokinase MptE-like protein [Chlamydiales bacterium]